MGMFKKLLEDWVLEHCNCVLSPTLCSLDYNDHEESCACYTGLKNYNSTISEVTE